MMKLDDALMAATQKKTELIDNGERERENVLAAGRNVLKPLEIANLYLLRVSFSSTSLFRI